MRRNERPGPRRGFSAAGAAGRLACLCLLVATGVSCSGSSQPGEIPWLEPFADGIFLEPGHHIDFGERFRSQDKRGEWHLPSSHLADIGEGWALPEDWGIWGIGRHSTLHFFLTATKDYDLFLLCRSAPFPDRRDQVVEIRINGQSAGRLVVGPGWQRHHLPVPQGLLQPGDNAVELDYAHHLDGIPGVDQRALALGIQEVGLVARDEEPPERSAEQGSHFVTEHEKLVLTRSGIYLVPLEVPAAARALRWSMRSAEPATLRTSVLQLDGRRELLHEAAHDGSHEIQLGAYRGRKIFLVLEADLPSGGPLALRQPRLLEQAGADPEPPREPPAHRPDIVLVVLDSARADHFGAYDYAHATTPNIDRVAEEGMVFRHAVAECPYTLCSMPSLLTGLTFVRHGLTHRPMRIADEVRTLAERLADLGYQTLGFTANPQSSGSTGSDQGFEEFYHVWSFARGRAGIHPDLMTTKIAERLDRGLEDRPLFLMLHYVPPHEPYLPDPPFDVFGDENYTGPVVGEQRFAKQVFDGKQTLEGPDLQEFVALYDGNLLMADAAIGRLIAMLEKAGRWHRTLFVLTSDHGEAFAEHGAFGHNSTLYEEMLRVPLIVRLPGGSRPDHVVREDRFVSLRDVAPTLLAQVSGSIPDELHGVDLLAPPASGGRERLLILRTAHTVGATYGVRTPRFKLVVRASKVPVFGNHRLYDLGDDAGETTDRSAEHRLLQAALALELERALAQASATRVDEQEELSPRELEVLRSLGYVN